MSRIIQRGKPKDVVVVIHGGGDGGGGRIWVLGFDFGGRKGWALGLGDGKKSNFSRNKQRWKVRERKCVTARRKEPLHMDSRRGNTSTQTELSLEGMVVCSGTETSTTTSSAIFCWLMLFRLFLVLQILSLTVSLSLCFALGLCWSMHAQCAFA